jgi:putative peptidoglycan lipid II flippase
MTSRVLGLTRDQVLAYFFGAGDAMDAFRIAFRIPNVLRDLFAEGALSAALVPTFTRALAAGDRGAVWRLASNVISVLLLTSGAIVLAGIVFAEPLVNLYAGGFREVPGKLELTIYLTRLMFPFLCMVAVAAVLMALLNALHHFFVPAVSPAMFNVATITCAFLRPAHRARSNRSWRPPPVRWAGSGRSCRGRRYAARDSAMTASSTGTIPGSARSGG